MFRKDICFDKVDSFLNYFLSWNSALDGFIFRGHSKIEYQLTPSSLREYERARIKKLAGSSGLSAGHSEHEYFQIQIEYNRLRRFYIMCDRQGMKVPYSDFLRKNLSSNFDDNIYKFIQDKHEWIPHYLDELAGLAQHYGIPTRLLDWTYDPYVALHFALKGAVDEGDLDGELCIYCLNKKLLADDILPKVGPKIRFITPAYAGNPNLNAQQGLFTHIPVSAAVINADGSGTYVDRRPFDARVLEIIPMQHHEDNIFQRVILPAALAKAAYIALENHGYGLSKIFPGYDGIARQLLEEDKIRWS